MPSPPKPRKLPRAAGSPRAYGSARRQTTDFTEYATMPVILVLTATSPDKPGLIDLLSTTLAAHGANWQQSRMATLGG
ncbi:MAG: ACT domain-containing protein, partial [Gammaproteobacteria bacterium]